MQALSQHPTRRTTTAARRRETRVWLDVGPHQGLQESALAVPGRAHGALESVKDGLSMMMTTVPAT